MYSELLSVANFNKLLILNAIYHKNCSLQELATKLKLPVRTAKHYIQELNKELTDFEGEASLIHVSSKGVYSILDEYRDDFIITFHELKLNYLKASSSFQLLTLFTTRYKISMTELEDELFLSYSYIRRLIKQTNGLLKNYHFKIARTRDGQLHLLGDEKSIRIFSFVFLMEAYQTIEWPFPIPKADFQDLIQQIQNHTKEKYSDVKETSFYVSLAIFHIRATNQALLEIPNQTEAHFLKIMYTNKVFDHLFPEQLFPNLAKENLENEALYFYFYSRVFSSDLFQESEKKHVARDMLAYDCRLTTFIQQLLARLVTEDEMTTSDYRITAYYIYLYFLLIFSLKTNIIDIINLQFTATSYNLAINNATMTKIRQIYQDVYHVCGQVIEGIDLNEPSIREFFCSISYNLIEMRKKTCINIYVQLSQDFLGKSFVTKQLEKFCNPETVKVSSNIEHCDLIITDSLEYYSQKVPVFFLENLNARRQWKELLRLIQKLVFDKLDNKAPLDE